MDGEKNKSRPNKLIREKSPYLQQHAYNPVNWFPWGEEAFKKARKEDKPIFLSIGYSTCHWCHVMEAESFQDRDVADLINEVFVPVKVDREERPDIDNIYMSVCAMMTGSGGWPLTIFMTDDGKPFYAATYIPKTGRFGRPGMLELIPAIKQTWKTRRNELLQSASQIIEALKYAEQEHTAEDRGSEQNEETLLKAAFKDLSMRFDEKHGGFGDAPKFPTPHNLLFLLRHWKRSNDDDALKMVQTTLSRLRRGGVFDQVGYGFHRYSTDREWRVPHFEKMLYDQALLALAYVETFQATKHDFYGDTAQEIFSYVLRDLRSPEGGFYSARDADSEGVEGKYYVWTEQQIREILSQEESDLVIQTFNIESKGNFRDETTGKRNSSNILYRSISQENRDEPAGVMKAAREKLLKARETRVQPLRDDKILTDWNGLMIASLAKGGQVLGREEYVSAAEKAARFILEKMRNSEGRLLHRHREGETSITATLDDYAFFIWGLIELYETVFDAKYLKTAMELSDDLIRHYKDPAGGGFFFTPDDGEQLIVRKKEMHDGATPSGNAVAALNFLRLARLSGRTEYEENALEILKAVSGRVIHVPAAYTGFLCSMDFALGPEVDVVIAGPEKDPVGSEMLKVLKAAYLPNLVKHFRPTDVDSPAIDDVAAFLRSFDAVEGKAAAYVCKDRACKTPILKAEELDEMLE